MTYDIDWGSAARRAVGQLPEKIATACLEFVFSALAEAPRRVGKPLRLDLEGLWSARRGDFRIIYRIDEAASAVKIEAIEHRSDAYRPR